MKRLRLRLVVDTLSLLPASGIDAPGDQSYIQYTVYDLVAIDLDGTLLDGQGRVPARNREALHRAHAAGFKVVLCTGRAYPETRPIVERLGLDLDATVTVGGALINDAATGRTLERTPFAPALAREAAAWLQRRGHTLLWLIDADAHDFDGFVVAGPNRHAAVDLWLERSPVTMRECAAPPGDEFPPLRLTIVDETGVLEELSPRIAADFAGRVTHNVLRVMSFGFTVIEAFDARVSKWSAIESLCRRWTIDPRRTVAIGDDVNDVSMIRCAGLGVAVANAVPAARDVARRVVAGNEACGVADLLEELVDGRIRAS